MAAVAHFGGLASLAGVPENIDSERAEQILLALVGLCVLGLVLVIRTVQKMTTRIVLVVLLVAAGGGLWLQRAELEDCASRTTCRVFGQDVRVSSP